MKKIVVSCFLVLAMAIPALALSPNSDQVRTVPREMSGTMGGRFMFSPVAEDWTFTAECDVSGTLSHLGLSRMHTAHTGNLSDGTLSGGTFKILAANGDEIQGTYEASVELLDDSHARGTAVLSVEAGTGRFAHVQGTITAIFLETFDDPTWAGAKVTWVLEGTIEY